VPPTEQTPPNPYLSHIPDRDITLPSGKRLTLMNPAYMVRQMMADFNELYGIKGRITSLKPLNPANAPDAWERGALTAFEKGAKELFEMTGIDGKQSLRLMRPMVVKAGCLKCHAHQGYREGDIRGGVGVIVPMAPYLTLEKKTIKAMLLSHVAVWLLGSTMFGFVFYRGKRFILEQVKSEEVLREREAAIRELIANSPLAMVVTAGAEDRVLLLNKKFTELFGYTIEDIPDVTHWWPLAYPEKQYRERTMTEWIARAERAVKTKTAIEPIEATVTCKDGSLRYIEFHMSSIGTQSLVTFIDLTERKLAEARIQEQARLLDLIFDHSLDCIVILDKDYNFIRVSETYAKLCGRDMPEFQGRNHFELYPSPLKEEFDDAIRRRIIYSKSSRPFTFPDHPEWGVTFWDLGMVPIRGADDRIELLLFTLKNVTETKRAEEELGKHRRHLEELVTERTDELEKKNSELEEMNKLFVGRELRMVELKERIKELESGGQGNNEQQEK